MSSTATAAAPSAPAGAAKAGRRGWVALVVLVALAVAALAVAGLRTGGGAVPLSTSSTDPDGARAVARLLDARGTDVREISSLADAVTGPADRTVLVLDPASYSAAQLRRLAAATAGPVVLLAPGDAALAAVGVRASTLDGGAPTDLGTPPPGCDLTAARAAGPVVLDEATRYGSTGPTVARCYDGAVVADDRRVVLGDLGLLRNDRLADTGVAALDLNVLGTTSSLVWLQPGADAAGASGTVWDVLPPHTGTAAAWLLVLGLLVVLWRGRRLGAPVGEPLPVVVRAAEVVWGRARLHERAGERGRAAAVLRHAAAGRLRRELALPGAAGDDVVERAARDRLRRVGDDLAPGVLQGPDPVDDAALAELARALADVEDRLRRAGRAG